MFENPDLKFYKYIVSEKVVHIVNVVVNVLCLARGVILYNSIQSIHKPQYMSIVSCQTWIERV